jgi:hypothetical protein
VNEALKELKAAVQEADKEVTNAMDTEDAILEHLVDWFGNPIEMICSRKAEFSSWKLCRGTYEQHRDWFMATQGYRTLLSCAQSMRF